ncbi:hypothetical protein D3C87_2039900 [compost metagenome]
MPSHSWPVVSVPVRASTSFSVCLSVIAGLLGGVAQGNLGCVNGAMARAGTQQEEADEEEYAEHVEKPP